jgi:ubiquinone/menaquinone biosynthesis C-methylase UbiE
MSQRIVGQKNILTEIAARCHGPEDVDRKAIIMSLPNSYSNIKSVVVAFLGVSERNVVNQKIAAICYGFAAGLVKKEDLDPNDPFDEKVILEFDRSKDVGWEVYDALLPKDIQESIRGYEYIYRDGQYVWERRVDREKSISFLLRMINPQKGERIVDLGCGFGTFTYHCAKQGAWCVGVDYSPARVSLVQGFLSREVFSGKAQVDMADVENLPYEDDVFDKALAADIWEHLTKGSKIKFLKEARRVLRGGGYLYLGTPNLTYLQLTTFLRKLLALLSLKNPFRVKIPYTCGSEEGAGQHIGLTDRKSLERLLRNAGFLKIEVFCRTDERLDEIMPFFSRHFFKRFSPLRDTFCATIFLAAKAPDKRRASYEDIG